MRAPWTRRSSEIASCDCPAGQQLKGKRESWRFGTVMGASVAFGVGIHAKKMAGWAVGSVCSVGWIGMTEDAAE
jgi:hypothetical protein